jgi:hypothetical protein
MKRAQDERDGRVPAARVAEMESGNLVEDEQIV